MLNLFDGAAYLEKIIIVRPDLVEQAPPAPGSAGDHQPGAGLAQIWHGKGEHVVLLHFFKPRELIKKERVAVLAPCGCLDRTGHDRGLVLKEDLAPGTNARLDPPPEQIISHPIDQAV